MQGVGAATVSAVVTRLISNGRVMISFEAKDVCSFEDDGLASSVSFWQAVVSRMAVAMRLSFFNVNCFADVVVFIGLNFFGIR